VLTLLRVRAGLPSIHTRWGAEADEVGKSCFLRRRLEEWLKTLWWLGLMPTPMPTGPVFGGIERTPNQRKVQIML
jgi:hypothetical protein